ncbi:MAG: DUF3365 domain-containing protein [Chloroflexi bacterium]|nr:DUF3365 domain-containing protein [Chloroflexota bacterium]MCI0580338.1 DUF3365 domain-containing protein [Chloroflexota bacterium]MCI0648515.1 DUF3365 domain-containing protein [Chloroflexota bacterium]MCI0728505.1 DUF3365 domain-containing protein [Chloroflexota bacterium]
MSNKSFVVITLVLVALIVYLFASAPPPLAETSSPTATIPIETVFTIVEAENDVVRGLWTQEIVSAGKEVGLAFNEEWRSREVEAGPLPALFLRETAGSLERNPISLGLFLGSDFPINEANLLAGQQAEMFTRIQGTQEPQFFFAEDTGLYVAMFSDVAITEGCVKCHNEHRQSPKNDWQLGDVMGATTWSYPKESVTLDELLAIMEALRQGVRDAYSAYLAEVETFTNRPEIGERWPAEGYYLPSVDVFMAEVSQLASAHSMNMILGLDSQPTSFYVQEQTTK